MFFLKWNSGASRGKSIGKAGIEINFGHVESGRNAGQDKQGTGLGVGDVCF